MKPSEAYNLHPATHKLENLEQDSFDVICIGSGWAGRVLATRLAKTHTTLIIEKELFGGDCPFWACVPSKLMLYPSEVLQTARAVGADVKLEAAAVIQRRDAFIANRDDDKMIVPGLIEAGVTLVRGVGNVDGVRQVVVHDGTMSKRLTANIAVAVCTGSEPIIPKGLEWAWTPRDAVSATHIPEHLIIMGGGVVGCEMATAYASFGKVTLVGTVLPGLGEKVSSLVADGLRKKGVRIVSGRVVSASRLPVIVEVSDGTKITGTELLIAAGRTKVEIESAPWLHVLGDANDGRFTHAAKHQGRVVADAILGKKTAPAKVMPQVIFTQPTVATVGLTKGDRVIEAPYRTIASSIQGDAEGYARCVLDNEERILGFTLVGHNAGEVIHAGTMAVVAGMKLGDLINAVPSFPTCSEVYLNLLEAAGY